MEKNKETLAIIICWYGIYPWYLPYFIHSCSFNPTIDFHIIKDNRELLPFNPASVKIINKTLEEIKEVAAEKLGFQIDIKDPYKLCDFKPA